MHAAAFADELDIETVVVPSHPGNFSAMGLVMAKMRRDATATYLERSSTIDSAYLRGRLGEMAEGVVDRLLGDGVREESISLSCFLEMRCLGQAHEIPVPLGSSPNQVDLPAIEDAFRKIYAERYGRNPDPATEWEVISIRIIGEGEVQAYPPETWRAKRGGGEGPRARAEKSGSMGSARETCVMSETGRARSGRGRSAHYGGERSTRCSAGVARHGPRGGLWLLRRRR